jgi:UDP-GlcNAc:undecaprenyl-phosphate GlcNAc-1-phosphate transferase
MTFTGLALIAFAASLGLTYAVRGLALRWGIVDDPAGQSRKVHQKPVALLGGVAIYAALLLTITVAMLWGVLPAGSIVAKHLVGLLAGGIWLIIGGVLDDRYTLSPKQQIIWPILATLTVIATGMGIESISNPAGGQWFLHQINLTVFTLGGVPYKITLLSDLFTVVWVLGTIYATKFFDGLDGLVPGMTIIGALTVFFVSLTPKIHQGETALLALIVAACFAGFLIFNFNPASIFLGESGSTLAGFLLAVLSIIAESKVVTTLVVLSIPILDLIWVVVRRVFIEKTSPTRGDKKHIHHRLLAAGFSHRQTVLILYAWAIACGVLAFLYQGQSQWFVLFAAIILLSILALFLSRRRAAKV